MGWQERLSELVRREPRLRPPDQRFRIRPPVDVGWPHELPAGGTLPRFYAVCDGGVFPDGLGWAEFFPVTDLARRSRELGARLTAVLEAQERVSPFIPGRHVLFGWDTVGQLYRLWDAETDHLVGYMPFDDHDWVEEPYAPSLNEFFEEFFSTTPHRRVVGSLVSEWWIALLGGA